MEVRKGYKQTDVGIIPDTWELRKLKELSNEIGDGIHSTPKYINQSHYFFINGNNLVNGSVWIDQETKCVSENEYIQLRKNLNDQTILLSINGTIGNLAYFNKEKVILGKSVAYINLKTAQNKKLIYYLFQHKPIKEYFENELTGTTIRNLSLESLRNTPFPIPVLEIEQAAIAQVLSDTDELISSLEKLIEKKRLIKQGTMQQLLTGKKRLPGFSGKWEVKKLGEIAFINMGQSPSSKYYNAEEEGIPLIQGNADIKNRKSIKRVWTTQITKVCEKDDLIITVRAPVGIIGRATGFSCIGRGVCSLKINCVDKNFLYHLLIFKEDNWKILEQGSTFTAANSEQIFDFELFVPIEESEQIEIANILNIMDTEIEALQKKLGKYKMLKQGMMQVLLTGKIRLAETTSKEN